MSANDTLTSTPSSLARLASELIGSAGLAATVVGSGIMATQLSDDVGLQLTINALATGMGLVVLIAVLGPIGGAHFNPAVTLALATTGRFSWRDVPGYVAVQITGCSLGVIAANLMFDSPAVGVSLTERATASTVFAEVLATAGLVACILLLLRFGKSAWIAPVVGLYIASAYSVTSSTSFANPAITIARTLSDSFAGIAPSSVPWYLAAQVVGAAIGVGVVVVLSRTTASRQPVAPRA